MRFNVAALLMAPTGEVRHVVVDAPLDAEADGLRTTSPVRGSVRLMRCPDGVLAQGLLTVTAALECSRCLAPMKFELELELEEVFRPTVQLPGGPHVVREPDDPATLIDEVNVLDLGEAIRQGMLLAAPARSLCSADCRGLCCRCGADLNDGPCSCDERVDPRWAGLRAMLDEDD